MGKKYGIVSHIKKETFIYGADHNEEGTLNNLKHEGGK